jgi:chorismate dehydratase
MNANQGADRGRTIRVGAVRYLNARPLTYCLGEFAPRAELAIDVPSRLSESLERGELDVAMIPSIDYFRRPDYKVISNACIACRGAVRSVRLFSRVPFEKIGTLALDEGSRTSAALVRIILKDEFGLDPSVETLPIGAAAADSPADAVLVIGDRGIASPLDSFTYVRDLGEHWAQTTGLPFVFAMWIARAGIDLHGFDAELSRARDEGVKRIPEIARLEAEEGWISARDCLVYLRDHLHFYFGDEQRRGLELFYHRARQMGFIPRETNIELQYATNP